MTNEGPEPAVTAPAPFRKRAWNLAIAGLIPFAGLSLALLFIGSSNPLSGPLAEAFRAYSIAILSFLGGIRWGHALRQGSTEDMPAKRDLTLSVLASLVAWIAMFPPVGQALPLLMVAYGAQGAWDSLSGAAGRLPKWFADLRIVITILAVTCHLLAFVSL